MLRTILLAACLILLSGVIGTAQVTRVSAETREGVVVTISLQDSDRESDRFYIKYEIKNNRGRKTYFLTKDQIEFQKTSSFELVVNQHSVSFDAHGPMDYRFVPIEPRQSISGTFSVPYNKIDNLVIWDLSVGVAFLDDITDLQPKSELAERDPAAFRGVIASRVREHMIGRLQIKID